MAYTVQTLIPMLTKENARIYVTGIHGTGKTGVATAALDQIGAPYAIVNCSTMDPYLHVIGVPAPTIDPDTKKQKLELLRPEHLQGAHYIIFDEITRGAPALLNALFEIVQTGRINGEPLPNLKGIIATGNPANGEYYTEELDPAFEDRFTYYFDVDPECAISYFRKKHGHHLGAAAVTLWREYEKARQDSSDENKPAYISPRRMDMLVTNFKHQPTIDRLRCSLKKDVEFSAEYWHQSLTDALNADKAAMFTSNPEDTVKIITEAPAGELTSWTEEFVKEFLEDLEEDDRSKVAAALLERMAEEEFTAPVIRQNFVPVFGYVSSEKLLEVFTPFDTGSRVAGKFWALMESPRIKALAG